jgi:hypothetical protein
MNFYMYIHLSSAAQAVQIRWKYLVLPQLHINFSTSSLAILHKQKVPSSASLNPLIKISEGSGMHDDDFIVMT